MILNMGLIRPLQDFLAGLCLRPLKVSYLHFILGFESGCQTERLSTGIMMIARSMPFSTKMLEVVVLESGIK